MKFCKVCETETERYADGRCKPCTRACNAAWKAANPGKVKAKDAAWHSAHPEKSRAASARYRAAHTEKVSAYKAAYRAANRDKLRAYRVAYCAANPEKHRASSAAWSAANPELTRLYNNNRRARKLAAGGSLSKGLAGKLFKLQRGKCACGCKQSLGTDYHLDHRMPLVLGGMNTDDNMQLLRKLCNLQKHAKHPVDFMRQRGFLL